MSSMTVVSVRALRSGEFLLLWQIGMLCWCSDQEVLLRTAHWWSGGEKVAGRTAHEENLLSCLLLRQQNCS